MATFRKIGVLTSGGDAPGMNACAKAVVNKALSMGIKVVGINRGYAGLMQGDIFDLTQNRVNNVVSLGGTFLYSSRCLEFMTEQGVQIPAVAAARIQDAVMANRQQGLDGLHYGVVAACIKHPTAGGEQIRIVAGIHLG